MVEACQMGGQQTNPYENCKEAITVDGQTYQMYKLKTLADPRYEKLPFSIRVLLESAVRNCDDFNIKRKQNIYGCNVSFLLEADIETILDWKVSSEQDLEIPFKPARVLLQDFTGVPAVVDLAAMRTAMQEQGGDPAKINPLCQVDLVIDHSI